MPRMHVEKTLKIAKALKVPNLRCPPAEPSIVTLTYSSTIQQLSKRLILALIEDHF